MKTLVVGATAGMLLAGGTPAFASGTASVGGVGFATVTASARNYSTYVVGCWHGDASTLYVTGSWIVSETMSRSDGTAVKDTQILTGSPTGGGCISIPKNGTAAGEFTIQAQYVGVGGQVYGSGEASAAWGPSIAIETP